MQYNIQSHHGTPPQVRALTRARRDGAFAAYTAEIKRVCRALKVDPTPLLERAGAVRDPACKAHSTTVARGGAVHFTTIR